MSTGLVVAVVVFAIFATIFLFAFAELKRGPEKHVDAAAGVCVAAMAGMIFGLGILLGAVLR